jgi:ABC-2 type transport system ATP-binding protein
MSLMAQDLIVIGRGRLIQQSSVGDFVAKHASSWVRVKSPQLPRLLEAVNRAGATVKLIGDAIAPEGADVLGLTIEAVGDVAHAEGIALHELSGQTESLEDAFLTATAFSQEYRSGRPA